MRTHITTATYWLLLAVGSLVAVATGADLAIGDHHPVPEQALAGLLPRSVLLVVVAVLALVVAGTAATMAATTRPARRPATDPRAALAVGGVSLLLLVLLVLSAELLAMVGYLPLALVLSPFDDGMRESFRAALNHSLLSQLAVVAGALLWGASARRCVRTVPQTLPAWMRPAAAARWGRVAVAVAVVPPLVYAATRFAWLIHPLGFDRAVWEAQRVAGSLLPGVWLGGFAVLGAGLTLGLVQRWGEVVPRWVPGLAGRRVPVALAVVPASLVALILVPAGISMIRQVVAGAAEIDIIADWAAFGPTFLWPLWGAALGVATLGYALRRRGEPDSARAAGEASPLAGAR